MIRYRTRRPPPIAPEAEADFLTPAELEDREAGSMVHDALDKQIMSAADEKRARKAAKKAEQLARTRAGQGLPVDEPDCRCIDCGGDQPGHDSTCSYRAEIAGYEGGVP